MKGEKMALQNQSMCRYKTILPKRARKYILPSILLADNFANVKQMMIPMKSKCSTIIDRYHCYTYAPIYYKFPQEVSQDCIANRRIYRYY